MSGGRSVKGSNKLSVRLALERTENAKKIDETLDEMFDTVGYMGAGLLCSAPDEEEDYTPTIADEKLAILTVAEHGLQIGANLAGGCLRDYILGNHKNLKDYDLFFHGADIEALSTLPEEIFGHAKILPADATKSMREEVKGLVKYHQSCIDIVVVDCSHIRDTVKTFDASICQLWVENVKGEAGVFCTQEFLEYTHKKVWYWYTGVPTSAHLGRLVEKYGQYIEKPKSDMKVHYMGLLKDL